jgi:predicted Zn-dependent protease
MPTRREKLEALLAAEPHDAFLRYALANEYANEDRFDDSLQLFAGLRADQPPHIPSFLRGAQLLVTLQRIEEARAILRQGIDIARAAGELHPASEMAELLTSLGTLGE